MVKINCDLCGKTETALNRAIIEDVELSVCSACSKFGKVLAPVKRYSAKEQHKIAQKAEEKAEKIELLAEDYPGIIKKRREEMKLSQKDFALRINEKESTVHNIETGHFTPPISMARKLEKILGVKLVEEHEERHEIKGKSKRDEGFTLGDFIKIKK